MSEPSRSYHIDVVARALAVLDHLGDSGESCTLAHISLELKLDRSRTFRILETLRECGYVERDDAGKSYILGHKILGLKTATLSTMDFSVRALPRIQTLSTKLQDSVSIGVLDGTYVRYVARATFRRILDMNIEVGTQLPAHATSLGKLLLSLLPDAEVRSLYRDAGLYPMTRHTVTEVEPLLEQLRNIRADGYAISDDELELGLWGVAVPLSGGDGNVIAALSVSVPKARTPELSHILPELHSCAVQIAEDLSPNSLLATSPKENK